MISIFIKMILTGSSIMLTALLSLQRQAIKNNSLILSICFNEINQIDSIIN